MSRNRVVGAALGILVAIAGVLGLLSGLGVSAVEWRIASPLIVVGFGVWLILCSEACISNVTS